MRRAGWLFPCWLACTSATPPPDAAGSTKEAEVSPQAATEIPPICELGATRPCYPGPEATEGVGACKAGLETCAAAGFGTCTGAVVPAADEDCRTPHDEDCDGRSDDCPEVEVAFATAFTSDRPLGIETWGGGLGITSGGLVWVVEPGGTVIDVLESATAEPGSSWEFREDSDESYSVVVGGAWPGALLRTYQTAGTRAGYVIEQERWNGQIFESIESVDEHLQWRYEQPLAWRDGHAIALRAWYPSYESMEALDSSTLEHGAIEPAEQRKLQRKVDRLLARAKPRLVIVGAEAVGATEELPVEVDEAAESVEATEASEVATKEEPEDEAVADAVADEPTRKLSQPPSLPDTLHGFTALSDGTVVIGIPQGLRAWKPKQRRWTELAPPSPTFTPMSTTLHAGLDGELLVLQCPKEQPSTLWRRDGVAWNDVPLPIPACPKQIATGPDGTRWILVEDQLWQRRPGDAEPWKRVSVPSPWKPRAIAVFDRQVWISAEGEGERWAVLVDRAVPTARVLPPPPAEE